MATEKKTDGLLEKMMRVEPWLVGVWRFRELGRKPMWCATYVYDGNYYDVSGKHTPAGALDGVYRAVEELKTKKARKRT